MSKEEVGLLDRLLWLCSPEGERMGDKDRLEAFVQVGTEVASALEQLAQTALVLDSKATQLTHDVMELHGLHKEATREYENDVVAIRKAWRLAKRLNDEATQHVDKLLRARTGFTGEFPYHGWQGVGRAIAEILNERDLYRATLEEIRLDPKSAKTLTYAALKMAKRQNLSTNKKEGTY